MNTKTPRPEDILPDEINALEVKGIKVRKGTVAAMIANAKILKAKTSTTKEKQQAIALIKELAPALVAMGLHEHVVWKDPKIQAIIDQTAKGSQNC